MSKILISPSERGKAKFKHFKKSLVPTADELLKLGLHFGMNEILFTTADNK